MLILQVDHNCMGDQVDLKNCVKFMRVQMMKIEKKPCRKCNPFWIMRFVNTI